MGETAEGLLIANYDFAIIIHYVLAITIINQLCKQLEIRRGRAGCSVIGILTSSLRVFLRTDKQIGFHDIYIGQFDQRNLH